MVSDRYNNLPLEAAYLILGEQFRIRYYYCPSGSSITIDRGYGLLILSSSGASVAAVYLLYGMDIINRIAGVDSNYIKVEKPTEHTIKITDVLGYGSYNIVLICLEW